MNKFKTNLNSFDLKKQEGKILLIFVISLLVYIVFILISDVNKIKAITLNFNWKLIPLLLLLTLCNYFFRALRFYLYLRQINIFISFKQAFNIFLSGLSMTVTPGKSGEIVKAYLLKRHQEVSVSKVLPLLIIERMTDGIAMIILGIGGIFLLQNSSYFFAGSLIFVVAFVVFFKSKQFILPIVHRLEKKFPNFKLLHFFEVFFENSTALVSLKNLTVGILVACIAWAFEGFALYLIIDSFIPLDLFSGMAKSLFIFSFSSIAGFFVLIPGGIGVAEGSISYLTTTFFPVDQSLAVFITLLFRFITLWFGVCLGLTMLIFNLRNSSKK